MNIATNTKGHIPKVSIGMPVYNGEKFIREALDSLLAQTFTDFELIISDNASTDTTADICKDYALKDSRIRYVRQRENIGAAANFKFVLNEAVGKYFMWNAADDFRSNDCIEYYLNKIGSAGGVFSAYARINRKNGFIKITPVPILSTNQSRRESLKRFFVENRTSLYYGLFKLEVAKECLPREVFDWSDSYFIIKVISRFGFNTENSEPKYYAGFYDSYVPKPYSGKYVRPLKYFIKVFHIALCSGPVAFFYHLNILRISAKLNIKIWQINRLKREKINMKIINRPIGKIILILKYLQFRFRYPTVRFVRPKKMIGTYYSQGGQDLLMSVILFDHQKRENISRLIVDIGANHPEKFSNSLFFEKYFGCKTLAIDPLEEFRELWRSSRPNAEFLPVALGRKKGFINLNIPVGGDNMFSSVDGGFHKKIHEGQCEAREVAMTTLSQVLEERKITDVLLMSIDVEGFELEVLQGIDFDKVNFKAILMENNNNETFGSNELRDFMVQKGYVYYARVGLHDDVFLLPSIMKAISKQDRSDF